MEIWLHQEYTSPTKKKNMNSFKLVILSADFIALNEEKEEKARQRLCVKLQTIDIFVKSSTWISIN